MRVVKQNKEKEELWYFNSRVDIPWHKPGRMIKIFFRNPFDKNEEVMLPAVILNTHSHNFSPPTHDVGFWTSWRSGEVSGMLTITDMMPSRYMNEDSNDFSDKFLEFFKGSEIEEYSIREDDLFYTKDISDTERHLIYPFVEKDIMQEEVEELIDDIKE